MNRSTKFSIIICQCAVRDGYIALQNINRSTKLVSTIVCQLTVGDGHTTAAVNSNRSTTLRSFVTCDVAPSDHYSTRYHYYCSTIDSTVIVELRVVDQCVV